LTQQVVQARVSLPILSPYLLKPTIDFHFEATGTSSSVDTSYVHSQIATFLGTAPSGGSHAAGAYLGNAVSRASNGVLIEQYDITAHLDGSAAGNPIDISNTTVATSISGSSGNPEGVALLCEYIADYGSDVEFGPGTRPRARDRNRFFFGPINGANYTQETTTNRCLWDSTILTDLSLAFTQLMNKSGGTDATRMVVWSRKGAFVKPIHGASINTAPRFHRHRDPDVTIIEVVTVPA
jgi:hypothetical protein